MPHATCTGARILAFIASAILAIAAMGSSASATPSSLQSAFSGAATEFQVPVNVLLAVSYTVTRWESPSASSAAAAFGPMQLVDSANTAFAGAKGDESPRVIRSASAGPTVAAAAHAIGARGGDLERNATR